MSNYTIKKHKAAVDAAERELSSLPVETFALGAAAAGALVAVKTADLQMLDELCTPRAKRVPLPSFAVRC